MANHSVQYFKSFFLTKTKQHKKACSCDFLLRFLTENKIKYISQFSLGEKASLTIESARRLMTSYRQKQHK